MFLPQETTSKRTPPPNRYSLFLTVVYSKHRADSRKENNSKVWGADVIPFMRFLESFGIISQKMCQELRLLTS